MPVASLLRGLARSTQRRCFPPHLTCSTLSPFTSASISSPPFYSSFRGFATSPAASTPPTPAPLLSYVVTTAGPDRPGLVHSIAGHLHSLGANIEESRMTCLGTDFAVLLRISAPSSLALEQLTSSLQDLFPNFLVQARATSPIPPLPPPCHILNVSIEGPDQPGVVRAFTGVFARHGVTVRDLDTDTSSAPFAGYRVFSLRCVVAVPMEEGVMEKVRAGLEEFEEKWGFDVVVDEEGEDEGEEGEGGEEGDRWDDRGADRPHRGRR